MHVHGFRLLTLPQQSEGIVSGLSVWKINLMSFICPKIFLIVPCEGLNGFSLRIMMAFQKKQDNCLKEVCTTKYMKPSIGPYGPDRNLRPRTHAADAETPPPRHLSAKGPQAPAVPVTPSYALSRRPTISHVTSPRDISPAHRQSTRWAPPPLPATGGGDGLVSRVWRGTPEPLGREQLGRGEREMPWANQGSDARSSIF